jgi:aspartyl protease family protein
MSAVAAVVLMLAQPAGLPPAPTWRKDAPVPPPVSMEMRSGAPAVPASTSGTADRSVARSPDGHFYLDGLVNGMGVRFVVDTGAGAVMLTPYDAQRLGLKVGPGDFTRRAVTAGGITYVAPVTLDLVAVGGRQVRNVPAVVSSNDSGVSLLGMSFLKHMKRVTIENGVLKLE